MTTFRGQAWTFGDDIDTDAIIGAEHLVRNDPAVWAEHVLEAVRPGFARRVRPGDLVVAGRSFGSGSSREHAASALRSTGIGAVLAESFARNFYRNGFNNGLMLVEVPGISAVVSDGDTLTLDTTRWTLQPDRGTALACRPLPRFLVAMCRAGGLAPWLVGNGLSWSVDLDGATHLDAGGPNGS